MLRIAPLAIAILVIAALTVVEGRISDRWSSVNREATFAATLLEQVPKQIGDWQGSDSAVDEVIQQVAGAEEYVSRRYFHKETGRAVDVWLIVGHARDTAEHTPDSCYPASGFRCPNGTERFTIEAPGQPAGTFWTALFSKELGVGSANERVFWAWFKPEAGSGASEVEWVAPAKPRFHFGSTRALYKLYFTALAQSETESPGDNVALEFAKEFLPVVNPVLARANQPLPEDFDAATALDKIVQEQKARQAKLREEEKARRQRERGKEEASEGAESDEAA